MLTGDEPGAKPSTLLERAGDKASGIGQIGQGNPRLRLALQWGLAGLIFAFLVFFVIRQWNSIPDETLTSAAKLSERYITDRFLPDKAIDVIDEAGARARLAAQAPPPEVAELKAQLEKVNTDKEAAVRDQNFERAGIGVLPCLQ